ncbi:hypothetical protein ACOQFL_15670 [Actinopolyspora sp. H202]
MTANDLGVFVLGGSLGGGHYRDLLIVGFFVQTVAFNSYSERQTAF